MRSSTTMPPVEPIFSDADRGQRGVRPLLGAHHHEVGGQLALVGAHRPHLAGPSPTKASSLVLKCIFTPISAQDSSTGAAMSGSVASASAQGWWSTRWVSMPRWARAVTISRPSGDASTTTATLVWSRTLSHSIASRMFLT